MKDKKEITEQDLQILERAINGISLRLIDMDNKFKKSLGRVKGMFLIFPVILAIGIIIGYIL
jgi:hypothetical protein